MIRRLFLLPLAALVMACSAPTALSQDSLAQVPVLTYPPAPTPAADRVIIPPQENRYFPMRSDGQAFVSNEDITSNMTDIFNRYYFNPKWRGEEWSPYQNWWLVERMCRLMSTWEEYDNFSTFRFLQPTNKVHKWFERYSGYGP
jgi:hypothetical protein